MKMVEEKPVFIFVRFQGMIERTAKFSGKKG